MPLTDDVDIRIIVKSRLPKTLRQRLYAMRHHELLTELYLLDPTEPPAGAKEMRAFLSRDKLIAGILDWTELGDIESVNCPGCWAAPKKPCIVCYPSSGAVIGATPVEERLPRMYHAERRKRAILKVGLSV